MESATKELLEQVKKLTTTDKDAVIGLCIVMIERIIVLDDQIAGMLENQRMLTDAVTILASSGQITSDAVNKLNETVRLIQTHYIKKQVN